MSNSGSKQGTLPEQPLTALVTVSCEALSLSGCFGNATDTPDLLPEAIREE
jgi:hypothetical protein